MRSRSKWGALKKFNHCLAVSKSGKTASFRIKVDDIYGHEEFDFIRVGGWRAEFAKERLLFEVEDWDKAVLKFVELNVLKLSKNKWEAISLIDIADGMNDTDLHFWAGKFVLEKDNSKAWKAWKALYA